ncbi:DUF2634 domain-containing protein [Paenibacillus daejeonensis]|uniref:DUF2634 domain-containing protein n=1 Tax=Paenibacillus daejeonensis TaxID=135193 RepID=UPI00035E95F6|nr:DUF2634 domain-containing protein [Paenibacillus daejeonensis]
MEPDIKYPEIFEGQPQTTRTYGIDFRTGKFKGIIEGSETIKQYVFKTLRTARYAHMIYPDSYGSEHNAIGVSNNDLMESELARTITEALIYDERITRIYNFEFSRSNDSLVLKFVVDTIFGSTPIQEVI